MITVQRTVSMVASSRPNKKNYHIGRSGKPGTIMCITHGLIAKTDIEHKQFFELSFVSSNS
jgi:hypothetical protein